MVVPLGVGIGDFLAVAKLTSKIASELKENGEAASKYQDLIIELESLERALSRLYTLKPAERELVHLEAIRATASACKRPLESFLAKIEKFDKRLGTQNAKNSQFKGAGRRLQFNVAYEEDIKELRTTLASHVSKINLLLMTQILDSITTAETDRADHVENLKNLFEAHTPLLRSIIGNQHGLFIDLGSCKDNLGTLREKVDDSMTQGAEASVKLDAQQEIFEALRLETGSLRERLVAEETNARESHPTRPANSSSFISALAITSNLAPLVLSGTMIVSAYTLANRAREMSTIARKIEIHVSPA
ncbi:MAG: hypothetical protein ASARMPREDX12_005284 [Alectoria sarmentosa]|nr:MAG: hypothetical protein ASARMPREDX12_005284 [Alectoria sarmentosa]